MVKLQKYIRDKRRKSPKTFAKLDKRWDIKLIPDVMNFVSSIRHDVNPRAIKAVRKDEWLIDGPNIEGRLWELLKKLRRITKLEK